MVTEHHTTIKWERSTADFEYKTYDRNHTWEFEHGVIIHASAAPKYLGDEKNVDPEQAFVATISSCHMLTFLAIATKKRLVVNRYEDKAVGILDFNDSKKLAVIKVTLNPRIEFKSEVDPETIKKMHDLSHRECFIANSVKTAIEVNHEI